MDQNNIPVPISQLRDIAEEKFNHSVHRKNLREKIESQLSVAHNGGLFKATMTLITFLHCWEGDQMVIEDSYQNPIKIDRLVLLRELQTAYQYAMNAWHIEFEESKKIRKIPR